MDSIRITSTPPSIIRKWGKCPIEKKYAKASTTEPSDCFFHLTETLLDARWKVEQIGLFFWFFLAADLVDECGSRIPESLKCPKYWEANVTLP